MSYEFQKQQLMVTAREKLRKDSVNTFQNLGRVIAHASLLDALMDEHRTNSAPTTPAAGRDKTSGRINQQKPPAEVFKRDPKQDITAWAQKAMVVPDNGDGSMLLPYISRLRSQPTFNDEADPETDSDSEDSEDSSDDEFDDHDHFTSTLIRILVTWKSLRAKSLELRNTHSDPCDGNNAVKIIVAELPSIK